MAEVLEAVPPYMPLGGSKVGKMRDAGVRPAAMPYSGNGRGTRP
jgi:hypothetical protein